MTPAEEFWWAVLAGLFQFVLLLAAGLDFISADRDRPYPWPRRGQR